MLDVGANLGAYSIPLAKHLNKKGGRVYSFEPQRIIYYQLCANAFLNRLENVHAFNFAVGSEEGELEFSEIDYESTQNIGGFSFSEFSDQRLKTQYKENGSKESVRKIRLDDFKFPGSPTLLKIDVEGFELNVLKGAKNLLETSKFPPLILEIWQHDWFAEKR